MTIQSLVSLDTRSQLHAKQNYYHYIHDRPFSSLLLKHYLVAELQRPENCDAETVALEVEDEPVEADASP